MKNTSKALRIILAVIVGTVLTALAYYLMLPPINIYSNGFWIFLIMTIFFYGLPLGVVSGFGAGGNKGGKF